MLRNWLADWKRTGRIFGSKLHKNRRHRINSRISGHAEILEDRALLAVTALFDAGTLTVSLDAADDAVFLQMDGGNIDVGTSEGGEDVLADQAGVTTIIVQDASGSGELGQSVTFSVGDAAFTADVAMTGIETANLNQDIAGTVAGNAGTINVASPASIQDGIDLADGGAAVNVAAGIYIEDLVIDVADLELAGAGSGTTTIQGVATNPQASFPLAAPNINVLAAGVRIHDFTIASPAVPAGEYSSGIVIDSPDVEINSNAFVSSQGDAPPAGANDSFTNVMIQTWAGSDSGKASNVDGLFIHDNTFTGNGKGYYGVFVNPQGEAVGTADADAVRIEGNLFQGNIWRAIEVERSNAIIADNTITPGAETLHAWGGSGISVRDFGSATIDDVTISGNTITGADGGAGQGFANGILLGTGTDTLTNITLSGNTNTGHATGINVDTAATISLTNETAAAVGNGLDMDAQGDVSITGGTYSGIVIQNATSVTANGVISSSADMDLQVTGDINVQTGGFAGAANVILSPGGTATFAAGTVSNYTGTTTLAGGTTLIDGVLDNSGGLINVQGGATLGGSGSINRAVSVLADGSIAPGTGTGILSTNTVSFTADSNFNVEVNGVDTAGTDYDQLNVSGTVVIDPAAELNLSGTVTGVMGGDTIILINNDGSDLVTGTFANLADGDEVTVNGEDFRIFYNSGDGNDVALVSTASIITTVYVNDDFASLMDGAMIEDADPNTEGDQSAVVGITAFATIQAGVDAVQDDPASVVFITDDADGPTASPNASTANDGPATYTENVVIDKDVSVIATEGNPSAVIVDGSAADSVFTILADNIVILDSLTIQNGSATNGGGINNAGTLTIDNNIIQNNIASANGGGIHGAGPSLTIEGGTVISGNTAVDGGGLWMGTGTVSIDGTTINENTATGTAEDQGGGGIFNAGGELAIGETAAVTITNNVAEGENGSGGGIFIDAGGSLVATSSSITGNTANRAGGGIEDNSGSGLGVTLTSVTLNNNVAAGTGDAPGNGGGLHVTGAGDVNITGGNISGNSAAQEGGGLWIGSGSLTIDGGTLISNNTASGAAADDGGGGIFNNGGTVTLSSTIRVNDNRADGENGSGGGLFNNTGGTLILNATTLMGNTANRAGGGIEDNSGAEGAVTLSNVTLEDNIATGEGDAAGNGGGLHVTGAGDVTITGGTVLNNSAASEGGGLWNSTGAMTINGTTINANTASGAAADDGGGGIFNNGGTLVIGDTTGVTISGNIADGAAGSGGGIFNNAGGTVTISLSVVNGNTANRAGGGIEDASNQAGVTGITLNGVILNNNVATGSGDAPGNGGGLHVTGAGDAAITAGTVNNNRAALEGGGLWNSTGTMTIDGTSINGNTASGVAADDGGGGIFNNGGTLELEDATISSNIADSGAGSGGGIFNIGDGIVTLNTSTLTDNSADGDGGGLFNNGTATITSSTIDFNSVAGQGGGIWNDGTLDLVNATVSGNGVATDGGGIYTETGDATLQNSTVAHNRADASGGELGDGGGIHHDGSGTVTLISTIVASNAAGTGLDWNDFSGSVSGSSNLIGTNVGMTGLTNGEDNNIVGTGANPLNPHLEDLADNGGPTRTQAILPNSPALNAGSNPDSLATDQRGGDFDRTFGSQIDIGAFELQAPGGGGNDIIVTALASNTGSTVRIVNAFTNDTIRTLTPYGSSFTGAIRVAVADVNDDGTPDVITGAGPGGGAHIKVFDGTDGDELKSYFAFQNFTGGVFVAASDLDGDDLADIIVGADAGGSPHVKVFSGDDDSELFNFFAYDPNFTGGVRVAAGDITGDGTPDIITGAGTGGAPHVRVFDGATPQADGGEGTDIGGSLGSFFAYADNFAGGVSVAAGDVDGDGQIDLVTGAGRGGGPHVRVFNGGTGELLPSPIGDFFAFDPDFKGGVFVAASDITGDGQADLITTPGAGGGPNLRAYNADSVGGPLAILIRDVFVGDAGNTSGVTVAGNVNLESEVSQQLQLADGFNSAGDADSLSRADAQPIFEAALSRLEAAGLPSEVVNSLANLTVRIADLDGNTLGQALPDSIVLDINAAGRGWYIDPTPLADEEFAGENLNAIDPAAVGRIDLLTAIFHELAHHWGGEHTDADGLSDHLLAEALAPSQRRLPNPEDFDAVFGNQNLLDGLLN